MIVGNPSIFAIESTIEQAYERLSLRALGYFVIYVSSLCYGRRSTGSTLLACSFDEVGRRIAMRGTHAVPFATDTDAAAIAGSFREAIFSEELGESYFDLPLAEFKKILYSNRVVWAPDGDEAFDDGSYVLQFDIGHDVRVIAFKSSPGGGYDPPSLSDVRLPADEFYATLQQWHEAFEAEWESLARPRPTA